MRFKEVIQKITNSAVFLDWRKENPDSFLAYAFLMISDPKDTHSWEVGFYHRASETLDTFGLDKDNVELKRQKEEIFKKPGVEITELKQSVDVELMAALNRARALQEEKYPKEKPTKIIVIIQNIDDIPTYNISYVTASMNTLNIRINADNGDVVSDKLVTIFEFKGKND